MTLAKAPVKGMKDILPEEMAVRDYAISLIKDTYSRFGFTPIETPALENIANLTNKQGGENEKLIFKIMKRGEKLSLDQAKTPEDLVDSGLRYDLTVPLCRYYANNLDKLPSPFKALQIGSVWRADRPQRGRFRQFTQCDIDILGDGSCLAEIELISATSTLLGKLGFKGFVIRINDRRLLKAMAAHSGIPQESYDKVFIILDKLDKIGLAGVEKDLLEAGFAPETVSSYLEFFRDLDSTELLEQCSRRLISGDGKDDAGENRELSAVAENLKQIMDCVSATKSCDFQLVYDPTLVRGMSYYTGPIFEITMAEFGSSVGGGGRYDHMVGSFTNLNVPACGFSIGFERIVTILLEQGFQVPKTGNKVAFLVEKGLSGEALARMFAQAQNQRLAGATVLVTLKNKNARHQREQLEQEGYTEFLQFYKQ
ncbi:MAG: histidine--tRNA ligase [Peptococcaceae bacterium]|nr:histidine--tRNA ligase [Peptococcaceae bacterium]